MPWREIGNLGGILGRYTSFQQGMLSPSLHDDFASVLQFAPARALRFGLIETFSSPHTPSFAETLGQLYEHFDLRQRADLFNTILEVAPQVRELNFIKPLLSGTRLSVLTASSLDANDLMRLASEAEAINPGIIEEVTELYARRPTMLIKLDRKSKGMILTTLAHVKIGELESLPKQGGNFEIRLPKRRHGYPPPIVAKHKFI
jgi:hypothetical protein